MAGLPFDEAEYRGRQARFLEQIPADGLVLIPTNPSSMRSNDVTHPYRASSYMLYLCGWRHPESVLMAKHREDGWFVSLFVQPRDTDAEIWEGRRIGVEGAVNGWPIDEALSLDDLDSMIAEALKDCKSVHLIQKLNPQIDRLVNSALTTKSRARNVHGRGPVSISDPASILDEMRICKSASEIEMMQSAANIAADAHIAAMRVTYPGIGEWQIQAAVEGHFMASKSRWSYPSIVGGGDNATVLHYDSNDCEITDGDLVLVDAGCEVNGYASDITRTWPVNGRFSEAQKEIYELVLRAELAGIEAAVVGAPWKASHKATMEVISKGLIDLAILDCSLEEAMGEDLDGKTRQFFMHGTSHSLGLDVHDVGVTLPDGEESGRELEAGMVLTIEPGLYFGSWRSDIKIPERYAGIGIRIEDDILITDDGPEVLTAGCPKAVVEIESLVGSGV